MHIKTPWDAAPRIWGTLGVEEGKRPFQEGALITKRLSDSHVILLFLLLFHTALPA